ncbi:MAG TPA: helix-turn-helix domain-containing protein [Polyangiaceae bacterium]|nr:helix-turn-helix domain-containing protein [Polyangiaceae bacterium]
MKTRTESQAARIAAPPPPPLVAEPPPMRADAQRNRLRVLQVAREVFAAEGLGVPIDEIARRAGLGVGTLYRHFPTKEALLEAILVTRMEQVTEDARALAESDDAGGAFFGFLARLGEEGIAKKDLIEALARAGFDLKRTGSVKKEMIRTVGRLLDRAQQTGAVRCDVAVEELLSLVSGAFAAIDRYKGDASARGRLLAIVCDGLRPPRPAPVAKRAKKAKV